MRATIHGIDWSVYDWGVVYARLSDTRSEKEISIERQLSIGHAFLQEHGIPHKCDEDDFSEPKGHRSGWSELQRPAYRRMREVLTARKGRGLIWCVQQARFTRAEDATSVIRRWIDNGIDLVFDRKLVSLDTFDEWMEVHTRSYIHSIESQLGKERMGKYYVDLIENDVPHERRAVYGLAIEGKGRGRKRVVNEKTFPVILAFLKLYTEENIGAGEAAVKRMRALGHHWLSKQNTKRPITGHDLKLTVARLEMYEPFLPPRLYARAIKIRERRRNHMENSARIRYTVMFLRGVVACGACGEGLYQFHNRYTGYEGYRHPPSRLCQYSGKHITAHLPEDAVRERFAQLEHISPRSREAIIRKLTTPERNPQHEYIRQQRGILLAQKDKLWDEWLEAGLTAQKVKVMQAQLDERLALLPVVPDVAAARMDRETAETLFGQLPIALERQSSKPELANAIARAFCKSVKYNFATQACEVVMQWD